MNSEEKAEISLEYDGAYCYVRESSEELKNYIAQVLTYTDKSLQYIPTYHGPIRFSCYERLKDRFPTGLLPRVLESLKNAGVEPEVKSLLKELSPTNCPVPNWFYITQKEVEETMRKYTRGIVSSPTGSGKTIVMVYYLKNFPNSHLLVTVPTATLMDKTIGILEEVLKEPIGKVGDGKSKWERVTVGLVKSLINPKHKEHLEKVEVCIRDEAHGTACETHLELSKLMPNLIYSWGVSATPWRSDGKDLIMEGVLGPLRHSIAAERLTNLKIIMQPEYHQIPVLCPLYPQKKSKPELHDVYDYSLVNNKIRNTLIAQLSLCFYKNSTKPFLILVKSIEHGYLLQAEIKTLGLELDFVHGETKTQERNNLLEGLRNGSIRGAIASGIFNEGEDIKPLELLIIASGGGNKRIFIQQIGRVLRTNPNKSRAYIIDFKDEEPYYLGSHSAKRKRYLEELYPGCSQITSNDKVLEDLHTF